jgi:hypothetical protein
MDKGVWVKGQESGLLQIWFLGVVVAVLFVIGGVEMNPGPTVEQGKIDHILAYVKNQEKESKIIKQMVELHKQEMVEMKKSMDALGQKFDRVSEIVNEIMNDYGQVKQAIKEWETCDNVRMKSFDIWAVICRRPSLLLFHCKQFTKNYG